MQCDKIWGFLKDKSAYVLASTFQDISRAKKTFFHALTFDPSKGFIYSSFPGSGNKSSFALKNAFSLSASEGAKTIQNIKYSRPSSMRSKKVGWQNFRYL